jgi:hypothetical protein
MDSNQRGADPMSIGAKIGAVMGFLITCALFILIPATPARQTTRSGFLFLMVALIGLGIGAGESIERAIKRRKRS